MNEEPKPPTGSINEPNTPRTEPGPNSINEPAANVAPTPPVHTVDDIEPAGAALGDPDVELHVFGTGFVEGQAQIVFNNGLEETTFVSDTELTTIVRPSTAGTVGEFPVTVVQGGYQYEPPLTFEFIDDMPARTSAKSKRRR